MGSLFGKKKEKCPACKNRTKSKSRRYKRKQLVAHCDKYPKLSICN